MKFPIHMTPEEVAEWHVSNEVGVEYGSMDAIDREGDSVVKTGLLVLILHALKTIKKRVRTTSQRDRYYMRMHRRFLRYYRDNLEILLSIVAVQQSRIRDLFTGVTLTVTDMQEPKSIDWYGELYRAKKDHYLHGSFSKNIQELHDQLIRLRSVKTIEDISKLKGYGKKRSAAIIAKAKDRGTK